MPQHEQSQETESDDERLKGGDRGRTLLDEQPDDSEREQGQGPESGKASWNNARSHDQPSDVERTGSK